MRVFAVMLAVWSVLLLSGAAVADARSVPDAGKAYELVRTRETVTHSRDGTSSSSSSDRDTIVERVIGARDDGIERVYDLPATATREDRDRQWQFPVRVFRPTRGPARLIDTAALEKRRDDWLAAAKLTRAACGRWIFTWNAFRIECDPASVLTTIAAFDPGPDGLHVGSPYRDPDALTSVPLISAPAGGGTLTARMAVDPGKVRRDLAEADVTTGEITRQPVTLAAALRAHARDIISGTIIATFDLDANGRVIRRTTIQTVVVERSDGRSETRRGTEPVTRRSLAASAGDDRLI